MMLIAAALLFAMPSNDGCFPEDADAFAEDYESRLYQAHGKGLWIGGIAFTPDDIASATARTDRYIPEMWEIEITFTDPGNAKFIAAQRCGVGVRMEVSYDEKLVSRPTLNERILGGKAIISGGFTQKSATALAAKLAPPR